jgi:mannose-6-phosphate isomerase-like protein (cupin superfamily)
MGVTLTLVGRDAASGDDAIRRRFADEGLHPSFWTSAPVAEFGVHSHPRAKLLYCVRGSITFLAGGSAFPMAAGDRIEIDAGTDHAASVGLDGVECAEAYR